MHKSVDERGVTDVSALVEAVERRNTIENTITDMAIAQGVGARVGRSVFWKSLKDAQQLRGFAIHSDDFVATYKRQTSAADIIAQHEIRYFYRDGNRLYHQLLGYCGRGWDE